MLGWPRPRSPTISNWPYRASTCLCLRRRSLHLLSLKVHSPATQQILKCYLSDQAHERLPPSYVPILWRRPLSLSGLLQQPRGHSSLVLSTYARQHFVVWSSLHKVRIELLAIGSRTGDDRPSLRSHWPTAWNLQELHHKIWSYPSDSCRLRTTPALTTLKRGLLTASRPLRSTMWSLISFQTPSGFTIMLKSWSHTTFRSRRLEGYAAPLFRN